MRIWPWLAFFSCLFAFLIINHFYKAEHNPPVGVYIAIMGLVAACVTFRKEPSRVEKALWIILMTLLMVAEIRNLYVADREQLKKFGTITDGLEKTKEGLDAAVSALHDLWGETTGGDSYLWYEPTVTAIGENAMEGYKNTIILSAFPRVIGNFSLPSVHVEVFGPTGWIIGGGSSTPSIEYQGLGPNELARSRQGLSLKFAQEKDKPELFHVFVNTPNGSYEQQILIEKVGDRWEFGARLYKLGTKTPLRVLASPGFPKDW